MSDHKLLCESCPLAHHVGPTHHVAVEGLSFAQHVAREAANLRQGFAEIQAIAKASDPTDAAAVKFAETVRMMSALVIEVTSSLEEKAAMFQSLPQTLLTLSEVMLFESEGKGGQS